MARPYWDEAFFKEYSRLCLEGKCDKPDGGEYSRVLREWREAGRPEPIAPFIIEHANRPPDCGGTVSRR